jgi:hypothetical protein
METGMPEDEAGTPSTGVAGGAESVAITRRALFGLRGAGGRRMSLDSSVVIELVCEGGEVLQASVTPPRPVPLGPIT